MNSFPQRMAEIMRLNGIANTAKLAEALGYDRSERVRKVMSGESLPSFGMLEDIARTFASVNLHWLVTGVGSPRLALESPAIGLAAEPPATYSAVDPSILAAAREAAKEAAREEFAELLRKRIGPAAVGNSANGDGATLK